MSEMDLDPTGAFATSSYDYGGASRQSTTSLSNVDIVLPKAVQDRATALKYRLSHFYTTLLSECIDREKRYLCSSDPFIDGV